jgi:hypothetical protein
MDKDEIIEMLLRAKVGNPAPPLLPLYILLTLPSFRPHWGDKFPLRFMFRRIQKNTAAMAQNLPPSLLRRTASSITGYQLLEPPTTFLHQAMSG